MLKTRRPWPLEAGLSFKLHLNRHKFDRLLERARACLARGEHEAAVGWCEAAARSAWNEPPCFFASPPLEALLHQMGRALPPHPARPIAAAPRRVLHVLSEAYPTGGHTRLPLRWIRQDTDRDHAIVLTRQEREPVPAWLGPCTVLEQPGRLARARALRAMAADHDLVVLHTHPDDAVPSLAFGDGSASVPVIYLNHADHVFWLGAGVSTVVANLRESGMRLCLERRGVPESRLALLPIPLSPPTAPPPRAEARRDLGLPAEGTLLLTLASPYKYEPLLGCLSFVEAAVALLERHPEARLVAIGPRSEGAWAEASARTGGRLTAVGEIEDPRAYYGAADLFVGSFPVCSLTALIEAGLAGLPIANYCAFSGEEGPLGADMPAGQGAMVSTSDWQAYESALDRLIEDPDHRRAMGERLRLALLESHVGEGWQGALEALYRQAAALGPPPATATAPGAPAGGYDHHLVYASVMARRHCSRYYRLLSTLHRLHPQGGSA